MKANSMSVFPADQAPRNVSKGDDSSLPQMFDFESSFEDLNEFGVRHQKYGTFTPRIQTY